MTAPFKFSQLSSNFGCEVEFDLSTELDGRQRRALKLLYDQYQLLLFRNQKLSMSRQAAIVDLFGPVLRAEEGMGYISNVRADGALGEDDLGYHSDLAYAEHPYQALSLHAIDVVDDATGTYFISSIEAYCRLPDVLKKRLRGLSAMHVSAGRNMSGRPRFQPGDPEFTRPVLLQHPARGQTILYVTMSQTLKIVALEPEDSETLLNELFSYLYTPECIIEHRWRLGDLVIWDNLAIQHARSGIRDKGNRTLQRVVSGERGLYEQYPALRGLYTNSTVTEPTRDPNSGQ